MTQTYSKSRQQAETAFSRVQTQFFSKDHALEEQEFVTQTREAKTLRLREARLAKEAEDRARATLELIRKRAAKA